MASNLPFQLDYGYGDGHSNDLRSATYPKSTATNNDAYYLSDAYGSRTTSSTFPRHSNSMFSSNGNIESPSDNSYAGQTLSWESLTNASSITINHMLEYPRNSGTRPKNDGNSRLRRLSHRDEFNGPHQFIPRPPYISQQENDLPHLPTNLEVHEQDSILTQVNDHLSQCAFDFVAKYQFPIPLANDMRPVERPQDREWNEWVYLLKRLATKRRIPARVLYQGQIKQFITILENSLEMRHAAKHQSRPLKDDRNILQLISAGTQVAKILKDALAMEFLDQLYVSTERQIQDRSRDRRAYEDPAANNDVQV